MNTRKCQLCKKSALPRFPLCADCNYTRVMSDQYAVAAEFYDPDPKQVRAASEAVVERVNAHQVANEQPLSGGSNDYWKVRVDAPVSGGDAYTAECNDLIEALQMTYAEGNVLKAVWRHALARRGIGKQGNTQKYEAEKAEFFAKRLVELTKG